MEITYDHRVKLIAAALKVRERAYAPYSNFFVGAALLTPSGSIFEGCNVENASYGLAICAERNAITTMITEGEREIAAMAVTCSGGGSPCGACRQVMAEFGDHFEVYLVDADTGELTSKWRMDELLPGAFKLKH
jgi:cytidine deaminase